MIGCTRCGGKHHVLTHLRPSHDHLFLPHKGISLIHFYQSGNVMFVVFLVRYKQCAVHYDTPHIVGIEKYAELAYNDCNN